MLRLVFGVLALAGAYLGWQWYSGRAHATPRMPSVDDLFPQSAAAASAAGGARSEASVVGGGDVPGRSSSAPGMQKPPDSGDDQDRVARGILAGDRAALAAGFRSLRVAQGDGRERISQALNAAVAKARGLDDLLAVLGPDNAFLHTQEGRKLALSVSSALVALDRTKADEKLQKSTALLERCMHGAIAKSDQDAYETVNEIYRRHKLFVDQVAFNSAVLTNARSHVVKSGETLDGIAAAYRSQGIQVEGWTLCLVNRVGQPSRLRAGQAIKIPLDTFHARLEKASFLLAVYLGDAIVRMYWVGHGKDERTPETTFTVGEKLCNPDWYAPDGNLYPFGDPKNVLGRYFVKFENADQEMRGFGAHGTSEPESIRTPSSLGCIRMLDPDIEEFFRLIPRRTKVEVASGR